MTRRSAVVRTASVLLGLALAAGVTGCREHDRNGDQPNQDVHPTPSLQTVVPSAHPSPPLTVSPLPHSSASARRGNPPG